MKRTVITILVLLAAGCAGLHAQSLEEVCAAHMKALGATDTVRSVELELEVKGGGMSMRQLNYVEAGKTFCQKTEFPGGSTTVCVRNGEGWMVNTMQSPKPLALPQAQMNMLLVNSDPFGPIHDYMAHGEASAVKALRLVGEKKVDNTACYQVEVTFKLGGVSNVYLSKKDYLLVMAEVQGGTMRYSFYEEHSGAMFPSVTEIRNAMGTMEGTLQSVKVNGPIDEKVFAKPE